MFRTKVIKSISLDYYGRIKFASSSEIPILAQLAVLGKIASLPVADKIYRRNKKSVYHQEQHSIKEKDRLQIFIGVSLCLIEIIGKFALVRPKIKVNKHHSNSSSICLQIIKNDQKFFVNMKKQL